MEHFCLNRYPQFKVGNPFPISTNSKFDHQSEVLLRAGEIHDSMDSHEESKHLGYYSVQTIIRCLVRMKPEEKNFRPSEEIEPFIERDSQVHFLSDFLSSHDLRILISRLLLKKLS